MAELRQKASALKQQARELQALFAWHHHFAQTGSLFRRVYLAPENSKQRRDLWHRLDVSLTRTEEARARYEQIKAEAASKK